MDKSSYSRKTHTAPVSPRGTVRIMAEVRGFEARLQKRSNRLQNEVGDAWAEGKSATTTGGTIQGGVRLAFKELARDAASPDLELGLYICSKLKTADEAHIFNPSLDIELLALRQIMQRL